MPVAKFYNLTTNAHATLMLFFCLAFCLFLIDLPPASARQNQDQQKLDPTIKASLDVLLDEKNERQQRLDMARALIKTPQAHPALIEILNQNSNFTAKIIICEVIAAGPTQILPFGDEEKIAPVFIDALFHALLSDHAELSNQAASALSRCQDGIPQRLADIALDQSRTADHRLAAIAALELIYGKKPVETLHKIFTDDPNPALKLRAAQALAQLLYLPPPSSLDEFVAPNLESILQTDETIFLLWQLENKKNELNNSRSLLIQLQSQVDSWQRKYLDSLTATFNSRNVPKEKLEFISLRLVDQPEDALRIWAVQQTRNWCDSPTLPPNEIAQALIILLKPFVSDENPVVRQYTASALGLLDDNGAQTASDLLSQLTNEANPRVQAEILTALANFQYAPAADQALEFLRSTDDAVVAQAARTLGKICNLADSPLNEKILNNIALTLPQIYQEHPHNTVVKQNLIFAMKSIASLPAHQLVAREQFNAILLQALKENAPNVRVEAIDALTELHQNEVLPLILDLLNDPDSAVRQDVIRTIARYPQNNMLTPLHQRLTRETNPDVARAVRTAFETILTNTTMQICYTWALKMQNSSNPDESILFHSIIDILDDKIIRARQAEQAVSVEADVFVQLHKIDRARRDQQYLPAVNGYFALLQIESINPDQKNTYRLEIINLVLNQNLHNLFNATRTDALQPLLNQPTAVQALQALETAYLEHLENDQILPAAGVIAYLILPLMDQLPQPELKTTWDKYRRDIALRIIAAQKQLLNSDNPAHTPEAVNLLLLLDTRLQNFPADDPTAEKRLAWLQNAEDLIRGSKSSDLWE